LSEHIAAFLESPAVDLLGRDTTLHLEVVQGDLERASAGCRERVAFGRQT
jgi:hypothetical protein